LKLLIKDIKIKKRIRKDLGDLTSLIDSLRNHGLMNPVVVTKKNELIAGHRRIASAKVLGWKSIDVMVLDKISELEKLELEIEENVARKDFSGDELEDARARLEALKNPGIFKRILNAIIRLINSLFGLEEK
jgi:ParB family chromosome partitioning protein